MMRFKLFYSLSWWVKGPVIAGVGLLVVSAAVVAIAASGGGQDNTSDTQAIVITATTTASRKRATPTGGATVTALETPAPTPAASQAVETQRPTQPPPPAPTQPPVPAPTEAPPPTTPPTPPPTIDVQAVCDNDATAVGNRVYSLYQAKGYPATTYEGLSNEADDVYYGLCIQSSQASVDIYDFCYAVEAWRYFFDQEAGAQEWNSDCLARKFF